MSRIGKLPISIPAGVTVTLKNGLVAFKLGKIGARNPISANLLLGDFLCFSNRLVNRANIPTHRRLLVLNMKCENSGHFVNAFSSYYII